MVNDCCREERGLDTVAESEAWIRVTLPSGWEDETWDMVMAAAEMLNIAVHAHDHRAQAEHLNHAEASVFFGRKEDDRG